MKLEEGHATHIFCMVGKHATILDKENGFRAVPATKIGDRWVYDEMSPVEVYCCSKHFCDGEPR